MIKVTEAVMKALELARQEAGIGAVGMIEMVDMVNYIGSHPHAHPEIPEWFEIACLTTKYDADDIVFWIDDHS